MCLCICCVYHNINFIQVCTFCVGVFAIWRKFTFLNAQQRYNFFVFASECHAVAKSLQPTKLNYFSKHEKKRNNKSEFVLIRMPVLKTTNLTTYFVSLSFAERNKLMTFRYIGYCIASVVANILFF